MSAAAATLALIVLVPDLVRFVPERYYPWWVEFLAVLALAAYALAWALGTRGFTREKTALMARRALGRLDAVASRLLARGLALALGTWCLILLAGWVPHYLTWAMSRDDDSFAVLAQTWDSGILPYRDIRAYNFPGQTYLFWVLGKMFGWGCPVAIRAFDALCVILAGALTICWSRVRLGGTLPGLIGFVAFLNDYLEQPVEITAQRDWYTALFSCAGIMALEAWPGRWARLVSSIMAALALVIRPQAVLFLPAIVSAIMEDSRVADLGFAGRMRALAIWCLSFTLFTALAFAPVVLAGIGGDFVRSLGVVAYGGPYSKATSGLAVAALVAELNSWKTIVALVVTMLTALQPRNALCRSGRTWLLALLAAMIYRPIAPVQHFYLIVPLFLVSSLALAVAASRLLGADRLARPVLLLAILMMIYESMPGPPPMFNLMESWRALSPLAKGEMLPTPPAGCLRLFAGVAGQPNPYWNDYRAMLAYVRAATSPRTLVADALNRFPFLPVNGPTGRLTPFRAESGVCWMSFVDIDLDGEFAHSLAAATDSVVVWEPDQLEPDPRLRIERVIGVIHKYYEPAARFGRMEVWSRKKAAR
jgi:hypothetical protein